MKTKNLIIFAILSTLTVFTSFGEYGMTCQAQETELYPVRVNGKEGYIDATGRVVIKPQFDEVGKDFSEGLAPVKIGEKWGYVDKTGKIIITSQFDVARNFSEGLATVKVGEKYGYIDKTGRFIINPQFDYTDNFSEGLARVLIGDWANGKWGFIDKTGRFVLNPQYDGANSFSEGLACVRFGRWDNWKSINYRYVDKTGNYYYNKSFSVANDFSEGLAYVDDFDKEERGYIDKTGRLVIALQDKPTISYGKFKGGLATFESYDMVADKDGMLKKDNIKIGYIDKEGRTVINLQFDYVEDFTEGLACVRIGGKFGIGRYGFIDKTGTYVINPQYEYAASFRGGIAPVVNKNHFNYIDNRGNIIWSSLESPTFITTTIASMVEFENQFRK